MLTEHDFNNLKSEYATEHSTFVEEVRKRCSGGIHDKIRTVVYKLLLLGFPPKHISDMGELNLKRYSTGIDRINENYAEGKIPRTGKAFQETLQYHFSPIYFNSDSFADLKEIEGNEANLTSLTQIGLENINSKVDISTFNVFELVSKNQNINKNLQKSIKQIQKDVPRVDKDYREFRGLDTLQIYYNVLTVYSVLNQDSKVSVYTQGNDRLLSALLNLFFQYDYKDESSIPQIQADAYFCFARIMDAVGPENVNAWRGCIDTSLKIFLSMNEESNHLLDLNSFYASSAMVSSFVSFFVETFKIEDWYRFFDWVLSKDSNSWIQAFECFGCAYILHFKKEFIKCTDIGQFFEVLRDKFQKKESVPLNVLKQILKKADEIFENYSEEIKLIKGFELVQLEPEL